MTTYTNSAGQLQEEPGTGTTWTASDGSLQDGLPDAGPFTNAAGQLLEGADRLAPYTNSAGQLMGVAAFRDTPVYPALQAAIAAWNIEQSDTLVIYGGPASFSTATNVGGTGGRTIVSGTSEGMLQDGLIRTVNYSVLQASGLAWRIALWRPRVADPTQFDRVAQSDLFVPPGGGDFTYTPTPPWPCQPGDRLGVYLPNVSDKLAGAATSTTYYAAGDVDSIPVSSSVTMRTNLRANGTPPFLIGTGDSLMEGHNSVSPWHSFRHTGPQGNPAAEVLNQMRALVPQLEYQNYGRGGETWAGVAGVASLIAAKTPRMVVVQCGVNDISGGRVWADIEADMNTFLAAQDPATHVFISEVLPWTAGNDIQAAAVRALNVNYAAWCASNGATLISSHDPMGKIRVSTGQLDDLITAYNYDGLHLSVPAGVNALARIFTSAVDQFAASAQYDPAAQAFFDRLTTPPTDERKALYNTLIVDLKAAGVWEKLDALYILKANDAQAARQNLVADAYNLTAVGSPTFTADLGYAGDGVGAYLNTGFNPATAAGKYVLDGAHLGVWSATDITASSFVDIGAQESSTSLRSSILLRNSGGQMGSRINQTNSGGASIVTDSLGHFVASRVSSLSVPSYKDAVFVYDSTSASSGLTNFPVAVLAQNSGGAVSNFSARQLSVAHIGGALSAEDVSAFHSALNTYLTAVGAA